MSKGKGQITFASNMGDKGIPKGALPKTTEVQLPRCSMKRKSLP